jgi:hypothetical protein
MNKNVADKNVIWVSISPQDFKEFAEVSRKIEETNIFPSVLLEDNFLKIDEHTYTKGTDQTIRIFFKND